MSDSGCNCLIVKELLTKLAINSGNLADSTDPEEEPAIYMMAAHFYGHLSRIYSKDATEFINYELAVKYSKKSMYYLEECNGQDSIIYHMHGDALRMLFKENCNEILRSDNKLSNEAFLDLENRINEIRYYYNIAAQIGGFIYAATSTIRLLIDYLKFIYRCKNIRSSNDLNSLSSEQQLIRLDIEELIHALDMEELDEYNKTIYNNLLDEYQSGIMFNDYSNAVQYFQNRMDYLIAHQGSTKEIASVRQSLINARIAKYRKNTSAHVLYYAEIPVKEVEDILELLEKSFEQSIDINDFSERHSRCSAYNKWMNLAKFSKRDISKGILYAKQWKALTEKEHRYDPNPYYYLYVLYYLSVMDGNKEDEKNIETYRKLSYTYANNRGNRVDYIRDILVSGTGMGRLCDASVIENWGKLILKKDIRPMPLEGRFDMVESKKGIVLLKSPVKWINRKAKFQTRENNSLSDEQRTHTVRFYGGFSYEMITAINSSVRDITSGETLPVPIVSQQEKASTIGKATRTSSDASFLATASQTVPFGSVSTFEVNGIHHNEIEDKKLVEYAALAESASSHPISKSLQRAYGKEPDRTRVSDIQEISGNGIIAKVDGVAVAAGNAKLMKHLNIQHIDCHQTGTIIHMAIDGKYAGHIVISDVVKPHSKDAISALKTSGVEKTVMLTGDAKKVADQEACQIKW